MNLIRNTYPQYATLNHFNRLFDELACNLNRLDSGTRGLQTDVRSSLSANAHEDETHYYLRFEVPGLTNDQVEVEIEGKVLRVNVKTDSSSTDNHLSRNYNASYAIELPDSVDVEKVEAELQNGLLTVSLAKAEASKVRTITVKQGSGAKT